MGNCSSNEFNFNVFEIKIYKIKFHFDVSVLPQFPASQILRQLFIHSFIDPILHPFIHRGESFKSFTDFPFPLWYIRILNSWQTKNMQSFGCLKTVYTMYTMHAFALSQKSSSSITQKSIYSNVYHNLNIKS